MEIGLKPGNSGALIERLHRVLAAVGLPVEPGEVERQEFGPSTLQAVQALQAQRGLPLTEEIDRDTHTLLIEFEQNINIEVNEGKEPPQKPPALDEHRGTVTGKLVNADGAPVPDTRVSLFAKYVRSETHLGGATTDKQGRYFIEYHRPTAFNLVVRAYDSSGKVIGESATVFAAPAKVRINFTTAPDGVVRTPSVLTTLSANVAAQLQDIPLSSLKENEDSNELQFLANAVGTQFEDVAYLYIADSLGTQNKIQ